MKVLLFLGLVGAAIYGALVLSSDYLLPRDPGGCIRGAKPR